MFRNRTGGSSIRATDTSPKLVLFQWIDRIGEPVPRIQRSISNEFKDVSMNPVRAGFCDDIDYSSDRIPIERAHVAGNEIEFLHGAGLGNGKFVLI